ncbi:hypothetical protein [uncultured Roseivirga sp.]|uniref:hypothetical protein n=1 Tax=uncultured Roseivirga sp. TaxID=543088 RepID=UPI000D7B16BD|nr:hypothetical protein [uncultured Roseivirga sp.]PWL31171.1 MAG: hypothetical protein DCO95_06765 [Roseivirga sp. XM-24bin3]
MEIDSSVAEMKASIFLALILSNLIQGVLCLLGMVEMDLAYNLFSHETYGVCLVVFTISSLIFFSPEKHIKVSKKERIAVISVFVLSFVIMAMAFTMKSTGV